MQQPTTIVQQQPMENSQFVARGPPNIQTGQSSCKHQQGGSKTLQQSKKRGIFSFILFFVKHQQVICVSISLTNKATFVVKSASPRHSFIER